VSSVETPVQRDNEGRTALAPESASKSEDHSGLTDSARIAIPLGLALITGVFIALGIQGDLLPRLMRNSPTQVVAAFALGVVGVVIPLFALLFKGWLRTAGFVLGAAFLLAGTVVAIWAAVSGTGVREQPTVTLVAKAETTVSATPRTAGSGAPVKGGDSSSKPATETTTTVQISASALSLASRDRMLLRIAAYPATTPLESARGTCTDTRQVGVDPSSGGTILFWGETGPTVAGSGASSVTLSVSQSSYRYLCAVAVLSSETDADPSDARSTTSLVDLRNFEPLPATS